MCIFPVVAIMALTILSVVTPAHAASRQLVPAYPLYCQGPLTRGALVGRETTTPYKWAATGAAAASPAAGECSWVNRAARIGERNPTEGGGNVICDFSGAMQSVPANTYVEVGVYRDSIVGNCMHLTRYLGVVAPPFSATPALPPFVRQSIASLTPAQLASLRNGIAVMMSRPATDPTSYRFQANIHGTLDSPTNSQEMQAWNQCEHGSYFFTSWHRMYLYYFDRILRAAAGDPNLVLPYWNWTDPAQRTLPAPFRSPASASNSLYLAPPNRPTALDAGTAALGPGAVEYATAFADTNFDAPAGSAGSFGGQIAPAMHSNWPHGDFESQPHDVVHRALGGLMDDPRTAALDPIFWLHHANIDRMWNSWIARGGGRTDASDPSWLNTQFTFYDEAGNAVYLTGSEVVADAAQLNYRYDDETPMPMRHEQSIAAVTPRPLEPTNLLSSSVGRVSLSGKTATTRIELTGDAVEKLKTITVARGAVLRLSDIRYTKSSGVYYEVYINPPAGVSPTIESPGYVGNLALFALQPHNMAENPAPEDRNVFREYDISRLVPSAVARSASGLTIVLVPRGLFDLRGAPLPVPTDTSASFGSAQILVR